MKIFGYDLSERVREATTWAGLAAIAGGVGQIAGLSDTGQEAVSDAVEKVGDAVVAGGVDWVSILMIAAGALIIIIKERGAGDTKAAAQPSDNPAGKKKK